MPPPPALARLHFAATGLVVVLGVVHVALTPVFFDEFAMRVMWYVAQGLLGLVIGFLNFATARTNWRDRTVASLCHVANGLGLVFVCLYAIVDRAFPSYAGILIFVLLFVAAIAIDRRGGGSLS